MPKPAPTGKGRAVRIPLDYYKKPDRLLRTKLRLTVLALVATLAWWASGIVMSDTGAFWESRGHVAAVHSAWETKCEACHAPPLSSGFSPIAGENWSMPFRAKPIASDLQCQACHAGPRHSEKEIPKEVVNCGGCHRDHRGPDASLVNLPDSDCVNCHTNLAAHTQGGKSDFENVSRFRDKDHPEFKQFRKTADGKVPPDPGKLKFSHYVHMRPGQTLDDKGKPWTLGDIKDPVERERYRQMPGQLDKDDKAAVKLDCASCHLLDSGDAYARVKGPAPQGLAHGLTMPRGQGWYFQPTSYDVSCKACHPLTFDTSKELRNVAIPHHLQPPQVREFLMGVYAQMYIKDPGVRDRIEAANKAGRPLPGRGLTDEEDKAAKQIQSKLTEIEKFLYQPDFLNLQKVPITERYIYSGKTTCGECHHYESKGTMVPTRIVPTNVPEIWFKHAKFSHVAHRAVDCRSCHPEAYADSKDVPPSKDSADVMLPGIENCLSCHNTTRWRVGAGEPRGGVRSNCTECHFYHNRDHPLLGVGALARDPKIPRGVGAFLSGAPQGTAPPPAVKP